MRRARHAMLLLIMIFPCASAQEGQDLSTFDLEASGPATFEGDFRGVGAIVAVENRATERPIAVGMEAVVANGSYELWDAPYLLLRRTSDHPMGASDTKISLPPSLVREGEVHNAVALDGRLAQGGLVRAVYANHPWYTPLQGPFDWNIGRPVTYSANSDGPHQALRPDASRKLTVNSAAPWHEEGGYEWPVEGNITLLVFGMNARIDATPIETGEVPGAGLSDPMNWSEQRVIHRHFLLIRMEEAHARFPVTPDSSWTAYLRSIRGVWNGDLVVSESTGTGTANGTNIPPEQHLLQVIGTFNATVDYTSRPPKWHISGEPSFVAVDTEALLGSRYGITVSAAGAAIGVGLVAWALWAGRNHLSENRLLEHPARQQIAALVFRRPGIQQVELQRLLGLPRRVVRHHVHQLQRLGLITIRKVAGVSSSPALVASRDPTAFSIRPFLLEVPSEPVGESTAADVIAILEHPPARASIEALRSLGTASYPEVADYCRRNGLAVPSQGSTWARCVARLSKAGVLLARQQGRRKVYTWNLDMDALRRHQSAAARDTPYGKPAGLA